MTPWSMKNRVARWASAIPARHPTAPPKSPTKSPSQITMRRTSFGRVPTTRSIASSRRRCCTETDSVLETTNTAIVSARNATNRRNSPEPPANSSCRRSSCKAAALPAPVSTRRPGKADRRASAEPEPSNVTNARTGSPPSRDATGAVKNSAFSNCPPVRSTMPETMKDRTPVANCTRRRSPTETPAALAIPRFTTTSPSEDGALPSIRVAPAATAVVQGWPQDRVVASPITRPSSATA
jgi:hypothetical protein